MNKLKKFFKWIWYNKEQLVSILYNAVALVATNFVVWTDTINEYIEPFALNEHFSAVAGVIGVDAFTLVKIMSIILSVGLVILTIRNVCVKYGLSSLETIDKVLAEKAAKKKNKLTPEQKAKYKSLVSTLQGELVKVKNELNNAEVELAKITDIYNADSSLVTDFAVKRQNYEKKIAKGKATVSNIETKISEYKDVLNGKKSAN